MGDLFWDCPEFNPDRIIYVKTDTGFIDHDTLKAWVFNAIKYSPQHTFLFLTKQPQNLIKFSPFPDNCWVGVTVTDTPSFIKAHKYLLPPLKATVKFLSFEPLIDRITYPIKTKSRPDGYPIDIPLNECCDWVIIGSQTKPYKPPKWEWVSEIIDACVKANIPYFLKNNLESIVPKVFGGDGNLIQESLNARR